MSPCDGVKCGADLLQVPVLVLCTLVAEDAESPKVQVTFGGDWVTLCEEGRILAKHLALVSSRHQPEQ